MGVVWLALAGAGAAADYAVARPWQPDPQAMFGGHLIALLLLSAAPIVGAAVVLAAVVAFVQCRRSGREVVGIGRAAVGVVLTAAGSGIAYLALVQ